MLQSYFIAAIRNLRKNKVYTTINVLGLALGIACLVVIFVIVKYETSFDDYHSKADRIYRVNIQQKTSDGLFWYGNSYSPLADAIRREVTGVDAVTGVYCLRVYQINIDDGIFESKFAFFADQHYFDVFDAKWISGNRETSLTMPNAVVVTDEFARQFLGGVEKAMGATFFLENKVSLIVTGIVQAPPTNTDHPYTMLISYPTLGEFNPSSVDDWKRIEGGATYIVMNEKSNPEQIYSQLKKIADKNLDADIAGKTNFVLLSLDDNHDRNYDFSSFNYDFPVPVMIILSIVAGMIAFIACINYINLATAQSLNRAKEVGIRKTLGGSRVQMMMQYVNEAFVITLLAVVTGTVLASIGLIQLNAEFGSNHLQLNFVEEPITLLFIGGVTIVITLFAGFYPAFVLSKYKPISVLKMQGHGGTTRGFSLRRGLVLAQFIGAQVLILITLIMINQIRQFQERPISFDPATTVMLPYLLGNEKHQHTTLDQELKKVPGIISYTFASGTPVGRGEHRVEFYGEQGEDFKQRALLNYGDENYLETFNLDLMAGTNFLSDQVSFTSEVLVNETMLKLLELQNPEGAVGTVFTLDRKEVRIRGVISDFYTNVLSSEVEPFALQFDPERNTGVAMKIEATDVSKTLAGIEHAWKVTYPDYLCRYEFMDKILERQYGTFKMIFSFLGFASGLAIFIGCLGLYGLVSFMAVQRTKEIGIRKVLGATVSNIMTMFTKESIVLVAIAFVIAAPLAYFVGIALMMELPERVSPGIGVFLVTFFISVVVALVAVGYRSFNAAKQNPVTSLRNE